MVLVPRRKKPSKKQRAAHAASKAGKTVVKAKAVKKAPKTAAAVWTGKRTGKIVKGVAVAIVGIVTLKAIRARKAGRDEPSATTVPQVDATPIPDPAQPTANAPASDADALKPDPDAPHTPPHGDKGADVLADKPASGDAA